MSTLLKHSAASAMAVAVLLLAGCSQSTTQPSATNQAASAAKPAGPPQLVPAKTAFWPMYTSAHNWAPDVITLQVTAKEVPGFKNEAGKAAMWQVAFASPSLREYRIYSYSIAAVPPDIFKGVDAGLALPWGGITRNAMPVDLSLFNTDSDAAYQAGRRGEPAGTNVSMKPISLQVAPQITDMSVSCQYVTPSKIAKLLLPVGDGQREHPQFTFALRKTNDGELH